MSGEEWTVVEECGSCGYGPVPATPCTAPHREYAGMDKVMLCQVCRVTWAGNAALYDSNDYDRPTLRSIAAATNMILAALRATEAARGTPGERE